jgi:L-asparaginase II
VAGSGRFSTLVMQATRGRVLVKSGAEGVYCAALPALGLGIALKIDDGAQRAAEAAMSALLVHLGALDAAEQTRLASVLAPELHNWNGLATGEIRAARDWPA